MSYEGANLAEGLIAQVERGEAPYAKGPCGAGAAGYQVAVALMHRLEVGGADTAATAAAAFARALHDAWGVGSAECDNGVLLLLSSRDRQMFISTGPGAEAAGLDGKAIQAVLSNMKAPLRDGRYDDAVLEAVHEIGLVLSGAGVPAGGGGGGEDEEGDGFGIFLFFSSIVGAMFGWGWWSNRQRTARYKNCQHKLDALKRDQAALRRGQYQATSCPICLEDFEGAGAGGGGGGGSAAAGDDAAGESAPLLARGVGGAADAARASTSKGDAPAAAEAVASSSSSAAAAAAGGAASPKPPRKPLVLRCGHSFCSPCIGEWVKAHTTCPVCRRDIDGNDEPAAAASARPRPPCAAAAGQPADRWRNDMFLPELMFRTRRLGMLYPDLVTDSMTAQFLDDISSGRDLSEASLRTFEARHPARDATRRQELASSGRMGASASFGGGHSGGGGGGSSW
jgi:uncharacterized membrane protein YgcG